jgi:hypothetical protein
MANKWPERKLTNLTARDAIHFVAVVAGAGDGKEYFLLSPESR